MDDNLATTTLAFKLIHHFISSLDYMSRAGLAKDS